MIAGRTISSNRSRPFSPSPIYIVKEVVHALHRHSKIIQPKLERENGLRVEFCLIGVVSLDRHWRDCLDPKLLGGEDSTDRRLLIMIQCC